MAITDFLRHLNDPAPGFRCGKGMDWGKATSWTARVSHELNPAADAASIAMLRGLLGTIAGPFETLFAVHDGAVLYRDTNARYVKSPPTLGILKLYAAGIEFYPIADWPKRTADMLDDEYSFGWYEEEIVRWRHSCLIFGEICHSGNYFAVKTKGTEIGNIYYLQHDPFIEGPVAENLEAFLDRVMTDPAVFLYDMGCYTRYSDGIMSEEGTTDTQWIPEVYVSDVDSLSDDQEI